MTKSGMMKNYVYIFLLLMACIGCKVDDAEYLYKDELGALTKSFTIDSQTGSLSFNVYANKTGKASVMEGKEWLNVVTPSFDGDATIKVDYLYNDGFPRKGSVLLETSTRRDTVHIMQEGRQKELFEFPQTSVVVYNGEGDTVIPAECNVEIADVDIDVQYVDGGNWINSVSLQPDKLVLRTEDNPDPKERRTAYIRLSRTDNWGFVQSNMIRVTQTPSDNALGEDVSFQEVRNFAVEEGRTLVTDDWCLTAYVVSRPESCNMGEQEVFAVHYIDYESEDKTAYIESEDGRFGFRISTQTADDNVFLPDTKIRLMLEGASVNRQSDPDRFTIEDVTASMVIESVKVPSEEIPVKEKHISQLTDEDIYTYVTLKDCEIPVRKGCLTPINEGYTYLYSNDKISKFPILIRDIQGSSMYMYTNITCPYRRDGKKLPYGQGTISGIIVHEKYISFIDKDNPVEELCGNIGDYQIRHTRYEDLNLEDDFKNSFSALITEYRYFNEPDPNPDKIWLPTYGTNGYFTHTDPGNTYPHTEFAYLGPCGKENAGNVNGFGITLDDGTQFGAGFPEANKEGKGGSVYNMKIAWRCNRWWASKTDRPEAWVVTFSTEGIQSDHVSMQLSTHNVSQTLRDPRYWVAEWSLQGDMSEDADSQWHVISEYVVPDVGIDANTLLNQCLGYKQMDFPLPLEILGQKQVFIRLRPTSKAASSGLDYDESTIEEKNNGNSIGYFAIRYNKQQ